MEKPDKRTQTKIDQIRTAALELFATFGVDKVSMDEIAAKANVSKVTIYKYFHSKEELYAAVIDLFVEQTLAATQSVFNSDMDFLEKLKFVLLRKADSSQVVTWTYLLQLLERDTQTAADVGKNLQVQVKELMRNFFEDGKRQGYIEESASFEVLYLYSEIFRAGLKAKSAEHDRLLADKAVMEDLINLYFFGLIKRLN